MRKGFIVIVRAPTVAAISVSRVIYTHPLTLRQTLLRLVPREFKILARLSQMWASYSRGRTPESLQPMMRVQWPVEEIQEIILSRQEDDMRISLISHLPPFPQFFAH